MPASSKPVSKPFTKGKARASQNGSRPQHPPHLTRGGNSVAHISKALARTSIGPLADLDEGDMVVDEESGGDDGSDAGNSGERGGISAKGSNSGMDRGVGKEDSADEAFHSQKQGQMARGSQSEEAVDEEEVVHPSKRKHTAVWDDDDEMQVDAELSRSDKDADEDNLEFEDGDEEASNKGGDGDEEQEAEEGYVEEISGGLVANKFSRRPKGTAHVVYDLDPPCDHCRESEQPCQAKMRPTGLMFSCTGCQGRKFKCSLLGQPPPSRTRKAGDVLKPVKERSDLYQKGKRGRAQLPAKDSKPAKDELDDDENTRPKARRRLNEPDTISSCSSGVHTLPLGTCMEAVFALERIIDESSVKLAEYKNITVMAQRLRHSLSTLTSVSI